MSKFTLALSLFFAITLNAQNLPEAPKPKPAIRQHYAFGFSPKKHPKTTIAIGGAAAVAAVVIYKVVSRPHANTQAVQACACPVQVPKR